MYSTSVVHLTLEHFPSPSIFLLQYEWIDGSPYIFDNIPLLNADMEMLNTSKFLDYNLRTIYDSQYKKEFLRKISYLQNAKIANQSSSEVRCMAVFLSLLTTPSWIPVGCNDSFNNNYFLCEFSTGLKVSSHSYTHTYRACQHGYSHADDACWAISIDNRVVNIYNIKIPELASFLSSWSLGDKNRSSVTFHHDDTQCLKTEDFAYQRFKRWVASPICNTVYSLTKNNLLEYKKNLIGIKLSEKASFTSKPYH